MIDYVAIFIVFFAVIDPIGTVPVFIAATNGFDASAKRRIAIVSSLVASAVLLFFVVAGELILTYMSIPLSAFQISGGIVLFLFALSMIFGESKQEEETRLCVTKQCQAEARVFRSRRESRTLRQNAATQHTRTPWLHSRPTQIPARG